MTWLNIASKMARKPGTQLVIHNTNALADDVAKGIIQRGVQQTEFRSLPWHLQWPTKISFTWVANRAERIAWPACCWELSDVGTVLPERETVDEPHKNPIRNGMGGQPLPYVGFWRLKTSPAIF
jgi:hypothetical protein